ncbi:hypothetical protein ABS764_14675 [Flavobacterium sp. ST-87]|uniref:Copper chaperone CopZ n=1 Tax=Flavobacterium plantiphilum TaxID=3163297 RepID=A0ABW8XW14_9FLAO
METNSNILIFATNIKTEKDKKLVSPVLNSHPKIEKWNIDLEDIDSVLRIETKTLNTEDIIKIIAEQDYKCTELSE